MTAFERALSDKLCQPGGNCHPSILAVSNVGVLSGETDDTIFSGIRSRLPLRGSGSTRGIPDREILAAIAKARSTATGTARPHSHSPRSRRAPAPTASSSYGSQLREKLIAQSADATEADLWDASPIHLDHQPTDDARVILETLYAPTDILFIGSTFDRAVRPASEWMAETLEIGPYMIPNPLTGEPAKTKTGKASYRADSCVAKFRFAVVEFDNLSRADQLAFWLSMINILDVAAVIDTAGKSLHGWISCRCADASEWESKVERGLFLKRLIPMGVDRTCRNESRLSRLPGARRSKTARQRLLYLNP